MELSTLQIFLEVMRRGSFTAVAREHHLDPSSISRTIAGLEKELDVRLFERTTRRLSPTEAARAYFERMESLVEEMQQVNSFVKDLAGQVKGTLRVSASTSFGQVCLMPLLPKFQAQYPELRVELLLTDAVIDVLSERVDLAVRLGLLADSTLRVQRLMRTDYYVCASPLYLRAYGSPRQPQDLPRHNCLLFALPGFRSRWIFRDQHGVSCDVPVVGRTVISNAIALQNAALAGMGVALLPNWLIDSNLRAGTLVNLFPSYEVTATDFNTAAWLVYPSRSYLPLKVRVFMDFLKQSMGLSKE
jgi:DNA-binding transcriptional LysR family regulator